MGNKRIGITSEFVSLIKSREDKRYEWFISKKTRNLYKITSKIFPKKSLKKLFDERILLSKKFEKKIKGYNPKQIVEIGCGYDLKGFTLSKKNPGIIFIDIDFEEIIDNKKRILEKICKDAEIKFPINYHLISANMIRDELNERLNGIINKNKKTLLLAEGLTTYFNKKDFEVFMDNLLKFMKKNKNSAFFSHEPVEEDKTITYKILRNILKIITLNKSHKRFRNEKELRKYLEIKGFNDVKIFKSEKQMFYSIKG